MKTIRQWLETIPDERIRRAALANVEETEDSAETLQNAIFRSGAWGDTPEGDQFWLDCYLAARDGGEWPAYPPPSVRETHARELRRLLIALTTHVDQFQADEGRTVCPGDVMAEARDLLARITAEVGELNDTQQP